MEPRNNPNENGFAATPMPLGGATPAGQVMEERDTRQHILMRQYE